MFNLTNKVLEGVEKLTILNLQAAKSIFSETQDIAHKTLSGKDLRDLVKLQSALAQPVAEKAQAYSRHVYEIPTGSKAEFLKVTEAQFGEYSHSVQIFIVNLTKNAPAGSETAVALLMSTINAANTTCDTVHKATKQAVEIAESSFNAATSAASKATKDIAKHATRAAKVA